MFLMSIFVWSFVVNVGGLNVRIFIGGVANIFVQTLLSFLIVGYAIANPEMFSKVM